MWCDGTPGGLSTFGAAIVSYTADGRIAGQRPVSYPSDSEPQYVCGSPRDLSQQQVRQLFNKDFTLLAGIVRAANGQGRQATALDLESGQVVGPRPDPDAFGVAPRHSSPVFQSGTDLLWYQDQDRRIWSRDARATQAPAPERGRSAGNGFMLEGSTVWTPLSWSMLSASAEAIAPGGAIAAVFDEVWGLHLVRNGQEDTDTPKLGPSRYGDKNLPGSDRVPDGCSPRFWSGPTVLVCANARALVRVTFAADHGSVTRVESLLPENDRDNSEAVLAADGRTAYFVSRAGSGPPALYRLALDTPNAVPAKVVDLSGPANARSAQLHLLATQ
ncbi:hypothetical protein OG948_59810 (plasmid) [Embleya sp. NBC_00888]|uniref:hypothetical protein n=1 Tax=Embleya sp. NBC_00888 TaxID=2975960 RepID=UPI0038678D52|nr:hypothetical protein OG948_59810 [Embleya sp. NBC_00888]